MKKLYQLSSLILTMLISVSLWGIDIDVHLYNSANANLPDGGTAVLKYHDGSWHTATNDGNGNFTISTTAASVTYKMEYNHGSQQIVVPTTTTDVVFNTVTTTVSLKNSDGDTLAGGTFQHHQSNWSGSLPANMPIELLPGNHTFKMKYNHGSQQQNNVAVAGAADEVPFVTVTTTAALKACNGTPLPDGTFQHHQSSWSGSLPANNSIELLPGNHTFKMKYNHGSLQLNNQAVAGTDIEILFTATAVSFNFPGVIKYHQTSWGTYSGPMHLLPGNYTFRFDTYQTSIAISGCNQGGTVAILNLKDHNGSGLSGGKARGGYSANTINFHVQGATASNGQLFYFGNGSGDMTFEMRYNGTRQTLVQDVDVNPVFDFQTAELRVRMETCSGAPVDGGSARFKNGSYKYWLNNNNAGQSKTGNAGPGEVAGEVFPGTYDVDMQFRYGEVTQTAIVTPAGGMTTFKTTNVDLNYPNTIKYRKLGGTYLAWYSQPSMEFLPGDYEFLFTGGGNVPITVGPCGSPIVINAVFVKLETSTGSGIAGATAKYYRSGWKNAGLTDANGYALVNDPLISGNTKFRISHAGLSNERWQDISSNPIVVFATKLVSMSLVESDGATNLNGTAKYYAAGWKTFGSGTTPTTMELLPKNTKFKVSHGGLSNEKWQNTGADPDVVFQTELVSMSLVESDGTTNLNGTAKYYAAGWKTFGSGTTPTTMELLPKNTKFKVSHGGLSNEKWQNTGADPDVVFQTTEVSFTLNTSGGSPIAGATAKYYASGWKTFGSGTTSTSMELLANNIKFKVEHGGLADEKWQNIGIDPDVIFATRLVKIQAITGSPRPAGTYTFKYYGGGWQTIYSALWTPANPHSIGIQLSVELLPGNIKYRVETPCGSDDLWSSADLVQIYPCSYQPDGGIFNFEDGMLETVGGSGSALDSEEHTLSMLKFYPNPASTQVTIEAIGNVQIINTAGQVMYNGDAGIIDVSEWAPGIYLVHTANQVEKLVIK